MKRKLCSWVLYPLLVGLIGCQAGPNVRPEAIQQVSVLETVEVTTDPQLLSGVGSLLTPNFESERKKHSEYRNQLAAQGVDVGAIVLGEFKDSLVPHPFYRSRIVNHGGYQFRISVPYHALVQQTTLSKNFAVTVVVLVELVSLDGEVVIKRKGTSCIFRKCVTPFTLSQLKEDPNLLKQQYREAANDAIRTIVEKL